MHKYLECKNANEEGVRQLILSGVNVNQRCNEGNTPLQLYAMRYRLIDKKIVTALIEAGTNINNLNTTGYSVFLTIMNNEYLSQSDFEICQMLIEADAEVNIAVNKTHAFSSLIKFNCASEDWIKLLIKAGFSIMHLSRIELQKITESFKDCLLERDMVWLKLIHHRK